MISTQQFLKGLIMTLVGVVVAAIAQVPIVWSMVAITLIGTALVYTGKNAFLPSLHSNSPSNTLSWKNILSALLIAVGEAIVEAVGTISRYWHY